jgi:lysophospholipase L1-like esterase
MNDQRRTLWALMSTSVLASSLAVACGSSPAPSGTNGVAGGNVEGTLNGGGSPFFTAGPTDDGGAASSGGPAPTAVNGVSVAADGGGTANEAAAGPTTAPAAPAAAPALPNASPPASANEASAPSAPLPSGIAHGGAMPLISRNLPAYASYAQSPAAAAVDADYGTAWRTGHDPSASDPNWLAIDLSTLPTAQRTTVYAVWFNENGYNYDTSDGSSYTLPGDFEIQANVAAGGGQPPAAGWLTLATKTSNTLSSGANLLNLGGYNWLRFHCTASAPNAAAQNTDTSLQWNLYDAHAGNDGWKFGGDSITANSMGHQATNDSVDQLVHAQVTNDPAFEMAGHGGWSTSIMLSNIDAFLADFPGRYFSLALGTNDAPGNDPAGYGASMRQLIDKIIAAGKVPVVPTIPYTGEPTHSPIPAYNAQISALYASYGANLIQGPDLYTVIYDGRATMFDSPADLHPNAAGNAAIRRAWAAALVKNVYGG